MSKQTLITDYFALTSNFVIVKGYNEKTGSWHCLECGEDIGINNPRQLCGKSYCLMSKFEEILKNSIVSKK